MELSTAPMGAHPPAGDVPGCWDSGRARGGPTRARLSGVRLSGSAPTTTEGAPCKRVPLEAGPGQAAPVRDLPGAFPFPVPIPRPAQPCSGQPGEQRREEIPTPAPASSPRAAFGITPAFMKLLFWKSCKSADFCSIFPIPASRRFSRTPWAFSEMSNPRRSPQHLQCFVTALAKC